MSQTSDLQLKTPNAEQKLAIEHSGGVLLSAGAGSGKTFVLVEHIVHLFSDFCSKNSGSQTVEDFSLKLKEFFSEIVMMTFTKKAAGELSLRLQERFEIAYQRSLSLSEGPISSKLWQIANEQLDNIFVGTIHSFCYRLIGQGLIPGFSGSEDMISEPELKSKLNDLFDDWLGENVDYLKENELEHVLINKVFFRNHFLKVFSDTDLRVLWSEYKENSEQDMAKEFEELLPLFCKKEWRDFLYDSELFRPEEKKIPVWFSFMEEFSQKTKECQDFLSFCSAAEELFSTTKRMPSAPRKQGYERVKELIASIKLLRDFLKSYFPDLKAAISDTTIYKKNGELFLKIYQSLEKKYFDSQGLTFTDLEFFVWKALSNNKEACNEIRKNYNYFIIDEFQDTSSVQFSIVKSIVEEDMKKVFCVGDIKQAIYGFRGGELGVFQQTSKDIYQSLSLRNNYRSSGMVIQLNNELFDFLLPLGENYLGEDEFSVPMLKQLVPDFREGSGEIEKIGVNVTGELADGSKSLKPTALNLIEGREIASKIASEPEKNFCVLYRKLTPTRFLIPSLIERNVGFTCQVKIQLDQDPILALFCEFCRLISFKDEKEEVNLSLFSIVNILQFLNCPLKSDEVSSILEDTINQEGSFGLFESYKRFLWKLGLSSTNLDHPWPLVEVLCQLSFNNAENAFEKFSSYSDGNYSIDFRSGINSSRVIIMTAHSSKGLEFDNVILGGIHTNGVDKNDGDLLGKFPDSYKWFLGRRKTDVFRSPTYIREQEIKRRKSFSESKRLFYVAATRAVDSLIWVDISYNDKPSSFSKNSWINALRLWEQCNTQKNIELAENIAKNFNQLDCCLSNYNLEDSRLDLITPIYQKNSLGTEWSSDEAPALGCSAELSVTRLATLEQCARKFHLKNVLKLDGEEITDDNLKEKVTLENESEFSLGTKSVSSASRGTKVHEVLEVLVKRNFVLPRIVELDDQAMQGISWIADLLKDQYFSGVFNFISEEQIKFSLFGQMISGTPDLVIKPEDRSLPIEVWDYKTGSYNEEKCAPYWLQLYCYGLSQIDGYERVKLVLAFVDDQKLITKSLNKEDLTVRLFESWKKLSLPDQINQEHCSFCEYRGLCFPSS